MSTELRASPPAAPAEPVDTAPREGSRRGSRRAAARMALRDARRHPWRTVLVLALIGLPVFAVAFGSTLIASTSLPTPAEERHRQLWGFDGRIAEAWYEPGYLQSPDDPDQFITRSPDDPAAAQLLELLDSGPVEPLCPASRAAENTADPGGPAAQPSQGALCSVAESIPEGVEAVTVTQAPVELPVSGSSVDTGLVVADIGRQDLTGPERRFTLLDGFLPGNGQAAASPALRADLAAAAQRAQARGLAAVPQDEVTLTLPDGGSVTLALSGTVLDRNDQWASSLDLFRAEPWSTSALYLPPGSPAAGLAEGGDVTAYLSGEVPKDYESYRPYNEAGLTVLFEPVMRDETAIRQVFESQWGGEADWLQLLPLLFVGVLALAEAGLLAGAAFAVGARQQRRSTALLSVTGAEPATLRQTMVFSGLWCGLLAAGLSVLAGVGAAVAVLLVAEARHAVVFGPHVPWWFVLGAGALGVLCAVVAAWIPARAVSRQDVWAAIKGASGERAPVRRWVLVLGGVLTVIGLVGCVGATVYGMAIPTLGVLWTALPALAFTLVGGTVLLLAGVLLLVPGVITGAARLAGRLPVSLRMAARDADRNRSRAVPVTAAVLAATAVGSAVLATAALTGALSGTHGTGSPTPDTGYVWTTDRAGIEAALNLERTFLPEEEAAQLSAESLGIYTGGAEGVTALLEKSQGLAGAPRMVGGWRVHAPAPTCATPTMPDCTELLPVYPESSVCHVPIPEGAVLEDRHLAVDEAVEGRSRSEGTVCGTDAMNHAGSLEPDPLSTLMVVDPDRPVTVPDVLFGDQAGALDALRAGQAVVFDEQYLQDGTVTLGEFSLDPHSVPGLSADPPEAEPTAGSSAVQGRHPLWAPDQEIVLDAVSADPPEGDHPLMVIPLSALQGTEQVMRLHGVLARFSEPLTAEQGQLVNDALLTEDLFFSRQYTDGSADVVMWVATGLTALLVITVAGMTAGLALADARRDQAVLSSIGANPRTRKSMAAAQTFTGALLGTVLGVPVGVGAVVGLGLIQIYSADWIPWLPLAVLVLGAPLAAAALTWLVVPGRLPVRQRDRD